MTTIITIADAAEFLALVPRLAGFHPRRSVVLVPFHGNRTLGLMRLDLPDAAADVDAVAATIIGLVCKVRTADGLAIVVYTDEAFAADDGIARAGLVHALEEKADACGLRIADALCVAADGWGAYDGDERRPLAALEETAAGDRLPEDAHAPLPDQSAGAELPDTTPTQRQQVAVALVALDEAMRALTHATGTRESAKRDLATLDPQALATACALDDAVELFEDALEADPARLRAHHAAALAWSLARPALRDVALVQWCGGRETGDAALEAQMRWEEGAAFPAKIAAYLWGEAPTPDAERLQRALDLVRHVAALAPEEIRAGSLAAAGWLCWALGRSTHAGVHADAAASLEPEHGLTGILHAMLQAGHLPEWAYDRAVPT